MINKDIVYMIKYTYFKTRMHQVSNKMFIQIKGRTRHRVNHSEHCIFIEYLNIVMTDRSKSTKNTNVE